MCRQDPAHNTNKQRNIWLTSALKKQFAWVIFLNQKINFMRKYHDQILPIAKIKDDPRNHHGHPLLNIMIVKELHSTLI